MTATYQQHNLYKTHAINKTKNTTTTTQHYTKQHKFTTIKQNISIQSSTETNPEKWNQTTQNIQTITKQPTKKNIFTGSW